MLTGDSASPDFGLLFYQTSNNHLMIIILSLVGCMLEILNKLTIWWLFFLSLMGLQKKQNYMWCYGMVNFLLVDAIKTHTMIFGPIPIDVFSLHFNGVPINFTNEYTYVGVTFSSNFCNIFAKQYTVEYFTPSHTYPWSP